MRDCRGANDIQVSDHLCSLHVPKVTDLASVRTVKLVGAMADLLCISEDKDRSFTALTYVGHAIEASLRYYKKALNAATGPGWYKSIEEAPSRARDATLPYLIEICSLLSCASLLGIEEGLHTVMSKSGDFVLVRDLVEQNASLFTSQMRLMANFCANITPADYRAQDYRYLESCSSVLLRQVRHYNTWPTNQRFTLATHRAASQGEE